MWALNDCCMPLVFICECNGYRIIKRIDVKYSLITVNAKYSYDAGSVWRSRSMPSMLLEYEIISLFIRLSSIIIDGHCS